MYKNVLKLLPQDSESVFSARAQSRKAFQELAAGRRKVIHFLDAVLCGIDSYRSGLDKAFDCLKNMCVSQKVLNKMELFVLAMAVRNPAIGPKMLSELWADYYKALSKEQHAMTLAWVSTRKEAMEWAKAMSPSSSIVCWARNWNLYGKFKRDYELPLLKLRKKFGYAAPSESQGNNSGMRSCFCLGGAPNVNEDGRLDVESGIHAPAGMPPSPSSAYLASRLPQALQVSFSACSPPPDMARQSSNTIRASKDTQAKHFSDSYRDLSRVLAGSQPTSAASLASSSFSTASQGLSFTRKDKKELQLAVTHETGGAAGSLNNQDEMQVHRRKMIEQIGSLSKQLSEPRLNKMVDSEVCPTDTVAAAEVDVEFDT